MNIKLLSLAVCIFVLTESSTAHSLCHHESVRLKLTANEDACRQECIDFDVFGKGDCFAYVYNPDTYGCDGYLLSEGNSTSRFEKCGVNSGIVINHSSDELGFGIDDLVAVLHGYTYGEDVFLDHGCELDIVEIGAAASKKKCRSLCEAIKEGNVYVACLAWYWDRSGDSCSGLLARRADNENTCGSL